MRKKAYLAFIIYLSLTILSLIISNFKINNLAFAESQTKKWSELVQISKTDVPSYEPKVAADAMGNVFVIWVENGQNVLCNTNITGDWGPIRNLSKNEVRIKEGPWPEIEVDKNGVINVVYTAFISGDYEIVLNRFKNENWSGNENISRTVPAGSAYPTIVIDPNTNDYYLFWQDNVNREYEEQLFWEIVMRFLNSGIGSWSGGKILPDNSKRAYCPQAAIDGKGRIYIVYANRAAGNITRVFFTQNNEPKNSEKWTNPTDLSGMTGLSFAFPQIACDNSGNIYVVWMDKREGNTEIYFRKRVNGKWLSVENLSESTSSSLNPTVAANKETGEIYVAWEENQKIFFREFQNKKWLDPVDLTQNPSPSAHPHLYVDQGGSIHIVFTDKRSGAWNIYYRTRKGEPQKKPSPPIDLTLKSYLNQANNTKSNHLNWKPTEENEDLNIVNYRIYRRVENESSFQFLSMVSGDIFEYKDVQIPTDLKFQYAVSAEDNWGQESSLSDFVSEDPVFPPLSISLNTQINRFLFYREKINYISWDKNPLNDATSVISYNIYRKKVNAPDTDFLLIGTTSIDERNFSDRGLSFDIKYAYAISSIDSNNNESKLSSHIEED